MRGLAAGVALIVAGASVHAQDFPRMQKLAENIYYMELDGELK
jgi:hypothetical protein